jgi:hypothetical protein
MTVCIPPAEMGTSESTVHNRSTKLAHESWEDNPLCDAVHIFWTWKKREGRETEVSFEFRQLLPLTMICSKPALLHGQCPQPASKQRALIK